MGDYVIIPPCCRLLCIVSPSCLREVIEVCFCSASFGFTASQRVKQPSAPPCLLFFFFFFTNVNMLPLCRSSAEAAMKLRACVCAFVFLKTSRSNVEMACGWKVVAGRLCRERAPDIISFVGFRAGRPCGWRGRLPWWGDL